MASDAVHVRLEAERDRLEWLTRKGIGMPAAGVLYWLAVAAVVRLWPQRTALVISFVLTGAVFPVGALLTRLVGGNLFAKGPSLSPLSLLLTRAGRICSVCAYPRSQYQPSSWCSGVGPNRYGGHHPAARARCGASRAAALATGRCVLHGTCGHSRVDACEGRRHRSPSRRFAWRLTNCLCESAVER